MLYDGIYMPHDGIYMPHDEVIWVKILVNICSTSALDAV